MNGVKIYIYVGITPYELELFKDEKISLTSTIQQINDIGKVFTDFTQTFSIPASVRNNSIFNHWYESFVDAGYDHRVRSNGYITIDGDLFREGKIQMEKGQIKNNEVENYSITFYGNLTQLKDRFKDDLLATLDYSDLGHTYSATEVINRVTSLSSYNVRYPLVGTTRRFEYKTGASNMDVTLDSGAILWSQLFPAIKVNTILDRIGQKYGVTFSGTFLQYNQFSNLWLYCKTTDVVENYTPETTIDIYSTSANASTIFSIANNTITTTNNFYNPNVTGALYYAYYFIFVWVTPSTTNKYRLYIYKNNVVFNIIYDLEGPYVWNSGAVYIKDEPNPSVYTFKVSSNGAMTFTSKMTYQTYWRNQTPNGFGGFNYSTVSDNYYANGIAPTYQPTQSQSTLGTINIKDFIPSIKVEDFFMGLVKMFNLVVNPLSPTEFELVPLELWYSQGKILDLTEYISTEQTDISRPKLFKKLTFSYESSNSVINTKFNELFEPSRGYKYGDMIYEDTNSNENQNYDIKVPFEDVIWERSMGTASGTASPVLYNFMTATLQDKNEKPYVPKPILMYDNGFATFSGTGNLLKINNGTSISSYTRYRRFSNEYNLGGADLSELYTLNWGVEISPWYLTNAPRGLFKRHYSEYIKNLYSLKTRIVNVKGILPTSIINTIKLNNRIIIRNKRYVINQMTLDLTSNECNLELITDFRDLVSNGPGFGVGYRLASVDDVKNDYSSLETQVIIFKNDFDYFNVGTPSNPFISYTASNYNTQDLLLNVYMATASNDRESYIPIEYVKDGDSNSVSIRFSQVGSIVPVPPTDNPPTPPTSSTFSVGINTIGLTWSGATDDNGISGYEVTYETYFGPVTNILNTTASTNVGYTITGLDENTPYLVSIRTIDNNSNYSTYYDVNSGNPITTNVDNPPTEPTSSTFSVATYSITVGWSGATDDVGITGYELEYVGDLLIGTWNVIHITTTASSYTKTITNLTPATDYLVRVKTKDTAGQFSPYYYFNDYDFIQTSYPYEYYVSDNYSATGEEATCLIGSFTPVYTTKLIGNLTTNDILYSVPNLTEKYIGGAKYRTLQDNISASASTYRKNMKIASNGIIMTAPVDCNPLTVQTLNILNYANSQGWATPSNTLLYKIDTYIRNLKTYDMWNRFDVFYQFAYNDASLKDFSRINWKSPGTYSITFNGTASYTIDGFDGTYDGVNSGMKLSTNFSPSTNGVQYTTNAASAFAWGKLDTSNNGTASSNLFISTGTTTYSSGGGQGGGGAAYPVPISTQISSINDGSNPTALLGFNINGPVGNPTGGIGDIATITYTNPTQSAYYLVDRYSSQQYEGYRNAVDLFGHYYSVSNKKTSGTMSLLSSFTASSSQNKIATFGLGYSLVNDTNNTNLYNILRNFRTSIGL